ncbi:MAG TPA: serine/threonine-protein kinase, partial [Polyangiales bacterium]|nr:serine/threonine-protein kinase [Polyangiales bacterium]
MDRATRPERRRNVTGDVVLSPVTIDTELVVGRYKLERELAKGGVGVVYRAFDLSTNRQVALKRLLPGAANNPRLAALFEREYHTLTRLKHPRIVEVFDYGIDEHGPYYTMELLDGSDLSELAPIPYRDACRYLRDVASSLALLHTRKRLHRDLSPRNVRITSDGRCKLLDFGTMANFGVPDEIVGTPPMVPPEALRAMSLDHRSDLYALGALAYRVLTNRHAYRARQLEDLPELWRTPPPRVAELAEDIPVELDELVMSMISLDPVYRPVSTSEVIDRLTAIGELPPDDDLERTAESYLLTSRLIGRQRPMETLQRRIARAHQRHGGTVLIEGNPGVGKSRLLEEASLQAQLTGALTIRIEARSNRGPNAVAAAIAKGIMHAAPHDAREAAAPHAAVLAHLFDMFATPDTPRASLPADPGVLRARVHGAFLAWLLDMSDDHTLVLLVDDLHRVDESSAALLGALNQEARHRRILIIATRRLAGSVSAPEAVAAIAEQSRRIRIHRLRRKDTLQLIRSLFGDVPNVDELGNWIHDITTGSPMQIVELCKHLADKDLIRFADGMWVLPPSVPKDQLPLSLAATMSARAAALSPAERAMAEALCVRRGSIPLPLCMKLAEEKNPVDVYRT